MSNCQVKYLPVLNITPFINVVNTIEVNTVPSDFELMAFLGLSKLLKLVYSGHETVNGDQMAFIPLLESIC